MNYEFNNWQAFYDIIKFIMKRHSRNFPNIRIEVPLCLQGVGWEKLDDVVGRLEKHEPPNLEEMSIYGLISFQVTKNENLNHNMQIYTRNVIS